MPTAAVHSLFWASTVVGEGGNPAPGVSAAGGYVPWQTSIVIGSGFGVTQVVWDWACRKTPTAWPQK